MTFKEPEHCNIKAHFTCVRNNIFHKNTTQTLSCMNVNNNWITENNNNYKYINNIDDHNNKALLLLCNKAV